MKIIKKVFIKTQITYLALMREWEKNIKMILKWLLLILIELKITRLNLHK